jgi:large subunit ribosomal protein L15
MVKRMKKKNRKWLGTRRWGRGNIKNARGKGGKGGVGGGGKKHRFTYVTAKTPWTIRRRGFSNWNTRMMKEIKLIDIQKMIDNSEGEKPKITLKNYKVLGNGKISKAAVIEAGGFSKSASEKIKAAGGEALVV